MTHEQYGLSLGEGASMRPGQVRSAARPATPPFSPVLLLGMALKSVRPQVLQPVFDAMLSSSVKIKESHQQAKPMIHLDRGHKVTLEFGALFDELEVAKKLRAKAGAKKRA